MIIHYNTPTEKGIFVKVPSDMKAPRITRWNTEERTLEFYSESYVMLYDSDSVSSNPKERELKEITLELFVPLKIKGKVNKTFKYTNLFNQLCTDITADINEFIVIEEIKTSL